MASEAYTIGIIGGRGHVGAELVGLLAGHPGLELTLLASRSGAGRSARELIASAPEGLMLENISPESLAGRAPDVTVLALGNGENTPYAEAAAGRSKVVLDLSADHRFVDGWTYGLPEVNASAIREASRIANPGCYATAMMLALSPLVELLDGPPVCFGVSGYSGAGATPSPRNDPRNLADNILPYSLVGHTHEKEVGRHLGRAVRFCPSVASFFRGIMMTVRARVKARTSVDELEHRLHAFYEKAPLVTVMAGGVPRVPDVAGTNGAAIGGVAVSPEDPREVALVCAIDNLRKGAASQALQNINLALGLPELMGVEA
ncbi:MAG: N-acetyl-gamma-glutamyl-phosphate reductase [Phycisphaerales bacterium]